MGTAKSLLILTLVVVWGAIVGVILLGSPVSVSMGGGPFPRPSVGGLDSLPAGSLGITTGAFLALLIATDRIAP